MFQVEFYLSRDNLSRDAYLVSQMDGEQFVSLAVLAQFKRLKQLTADVEAIAAALRSSRLVELDAGGLRVKPRPRPQRNTIILREIPSDAAPGAVAALFSGEGAPRVVEVRPEVGDNWFVVLESEDSALEALNWLRAQSFNGDPVRARMKTESTMLRSYFVPSSGAAAAPVRPAAAFVPQQQQQGGAYYAGGGGGAQNYAPPAQGAWEYAQGVVGQPLSAGPAQSAQQPQQQRQYREGGGGGGGRNGGGGGGGGREKDRQYGGGGNGERSRRKSPSRGVVVSNGGAGAAGGAPVTSSQANSGTGAAGNVNIARSAAPKKKGGPNGVSSNVGAGVAQPQQQAQQQQQPRAGRNSSPEPELNMAQFPPLSNGVAEVREKGGYGSRSFVRYTPESVARVVAAVGESERPAGLARLEALPSGPLSDTPLSGLQIAAPVVQASGGATFAASTASAANGAVAAAAPQPRVWGPGARDAIASQPRKQGPRTPPAQPSPPSAPSPPVPAEGLPAAAAAAAPVSAPASTAATAAPPAAAAATTAPAASASGPVAAAAESVAVEGKAEAKNEIKEDKESKGQQQQAGGSKTWAQVAKKTTDSKRR